VNAAGSVEGDDSIRLFCALTLPEDVLDRLVAWQSGPSAVFGLEGVRVVPRENLHITLAFLGTQPVARVESIVNELEAVAESAGRIRFRLRGYRATRSVGMLVCEDIGRAAASMAADLHKRLEGIGVYKPERRRWLPHITVLRFREKPALEPVYPPLDAFGPSGAAVYHSVLRRTGAEYVVLHAVQLGG
jgi:RNA 2',3'-cyclic 3'-phosphodiesterase